MPELSDFSRRVIEGLDAKISEIAAAEQLPVEMDSPQSLIESAVNMQPVLVFGQRPESLKSARRRPHQKLPEQPSLFGWN